VARLPRRRLGRIEEVLGGLGCGKTANAVARRYGGSREVAEAAAWRFTAASGNFKGGRGRFIPPAP
jgi:hypothetical protein